MIVEHKKDQATLSERTNELRWVNVSEHYGKLQQKFVIYQNVIDVWTPVRSEWRDVPVVDEP